MREFSLVQEGTLLAERAGPVEDGDGDLGKSMAEGGCGGEGRHVCLMMDPGDAFLAIARAEVGEEIAEAAVEGTLNAGHGLRRNLTQRRIGHKGEKGVKVVARVSGSIGKSNVRTFG